jgi:hypothetical protein
MQGRNFDYGDQQSDSKEGQMAKRSLLVMAKDLYNLYITLNDNDDLPEWCHYKLATSRKDLSDITDYLTSKVMKICIDSSMSPQELKIEIRSSMLEDLLEEGNINEFFFKRDNIKKDFTKEAVEFELTNNKFRYSSAHIIQLLENSEKIIDTLYNPRSRLYLDNNIFTVDNGSRIDGSSVLRTVRAHLSMLKNIKSTLASSLSENYLKNKTSQNVAANFIGILDRQIGKNQIEKLISSYGIYFLENNGLKKSEDQITRLLNNYLNKNSNNKKLSPEDHKQHVMKIKKRIKPFISEVLEKRFDAQIYKIERFLNSILSAKTALDVVYDASDKENMDSYSNVSRDNRPFSNSPRDRYETNIGNRFTPITGPKNHERHREV